MSLYADLLKSGWRMEDIDNMDLIYYLRVLAYNARGGRDAPRRDSEGRSYIDDVWPM